MRKRIILEARRKRSGEDRGAMRNQKTGMRRGAIPVSLSFLFAIAFLCPCPLPSTSSLSRHPTAGAQTAFATQNVVILVIDGLRNSEAFEDPLHRYIPHIWNDLVPQGTIYTEFYTTTWPFTTTGHLSMLTGTRSNVPLAVGSRAGSAREKRPTVFEVFRQTYGLPIEKTWIVSGKNQLSTCDYSLHPLWGEQYASSLEFGMGRSDVETMECAHEVVTSDHPRLVMINLRDVDETGHTGDWDLYASAIQTADSLAADLWSRIQSDTLYRDRTLLMVTSDHGRASNIAFHGGPDHSNRHVMFLALGPDVKQGEVVETRGDLIDIAPTVAEIFGLEMPYAEGRVLSEMFETEDLEMDRPSQPAAPADEIRVSDSAAASSYPWVAVDPPWVSVVWTERDTRTIEEHRFIVSRRTSDSGVSWTEPDTLSRDFPYHASGFPSHVEGEYGAVGGDGFYLPGGSVGLVEGGTPLSANAIPTGSGGFFLAVNGYSILSFTHRTELLWGVNVLSEGSGREPDEQGFENLGQIVATTPAVARGDSGVWVAWTDAGGSLSLARPRPGHVVNERDIQFPDLRGIDGYYYRTAALAAHGGSLFLAGDLVSRTIGNAFVMRLRESDLAAESAVLLDAGDAPSFDPRILADENGVYAVWADLESGLWQIHFRKSTDGGNSFLATQVLSSSSAGAWNPDIAADQEVLVVTWEDCRDGNAEVYAAWSTDSGTTWSPETRLTDDDSLSAYPRVACSGGQAFVVWQDLRDGNWEIYFKSSIFLTEEKRPAVMR